jgi:CubicO group peptidase (beta-lactamase class C family)
MQAALSEPTSAYEALREVLLDGLAVTPHHRYAGAVALIGRDGVAVTSPDAVVVGDALRYADRSGRNLPAEQRVPMAADTIFDIASLTKLFTAVTVLRLVELGLLDLDVPLAEWLPSYRSTPGGLGREHVTPRQLLTHVSGHMSGLEPTQRAHGPEATREAVLNVPLVAPPNRRFRYSCINYITLGLLCEKLTGETLDALVRRHITEPLGLRDTGYLPDASLLPRIAATEDDPEMRYGILRGRVHDETARALGGVSGNAGMFSTAADLAVFGEMLRGGGAVGERRVLRAETVAEMLRDQLPPDLEPDHTPEYGHGLGPRIGDRTFMSALAGDGAFGHTGFTGTSLVVDPSRGLTVVLMANGVHPDRAWSDLGPTRRAVANLAAGLAVPDASTPAA